MKTNWTLQSKGYYRNFHMAVEVYGSSKGWFARNVHTGATKGPARTMREAKLNAYEIAGRA